MIIKLAADHLPDGGDVAVLSASATATNQNIWIEEMNKVMGDYPGINVVSTVYGDDLSDKAIGKLKVSCQLTRILKLSSRQHQ